MLIIVSYDVAISTETGKKRLRQIAKICQKYGQRVQNSVFECQIDSAQLAVMRSELLQIIDSEHDSLRFYSLGSRYDTRIEHYGSKGFLDLKKDTLLI